MNNETRTCQNCKQNFTIESEDFAFYEKIKVPPPTFCPRCSHQRRFAWRNTLALYRRPDPITGKSMISIYHPDTKMNIVDQSYWWGDQWDPFDYGFEYDFTKPFFKQWSNLRDTVPFQSLSNSKAVNSEYCNVAEESYDCYLVSAAWKNERVMYADSITNIKDSLDLYVVFRSEFCYEDIYCADSNRLFYSEKTTSSTDSYFLYDCKGCVNCFMCSNLRNKSYCFENVQYSKEEYFQKIGQYNLGSFQTIKKLKKQFEMLKINAIHKYATMTNCHNTTGNDISGVIDSKSVFDVSGNVKDTKYLFWAAENVFSCYYCNAIAMLENSFESYDTGAGGVSCNFCNVVYYSNNVEYSFNCYSCHDVFGCIGLRNKSYCILNRQYTKEEYFELVSKIKKHMVDMPYVDAKGNIYRYGEFFPIELSPFAYNETIANDFYPLSETEAKQSFFKWRAKEAHQYHPTVKSTELPDTISEVKDSIVDEIIECEHAGICGHRCASAYKILANELTFYRRLNIPLPRLCYGCRHSHRFERRTPLELWNRSCMCDNDSHGHGKKCSNTFETAYAPDRPEKIFCEQCYQKEVL